MSSQTSSLPFEMTLRDYFAAKAMPLALDFLRRIDCDEVDLGFADHHECRYEMRWMSDEDDGPSGDLYAVGQYAYLLADAMLRASRTGEQA